MRARSLRDVVRAADAEFFIGRDAELGAVRDLIDPGTSSRILLVHGPGGIGKSALLRAAARIADAKGLTTAMFDARALPARLDAALAELLDAAGGHPFLVLDEVDHLGPMLSPLRDALLDRLPESARIVLAGRAEPEQSWHANGLPAVVVDLPLGPLSDERADAFLAQRGIAEAARRVRIVAWARGYPLALTVAASAPEGRVGSSLETHLEERLTAWLAGRSMLDVDREALEVAAIARTLDARLLAAALPGRSTRDLLPKLQALPVVQQFGAGVTLHPVLADAIRDRLKATAPNRYRALVRRIVEHLATRARLGDTEALVEMSLLIEDPVYRSTIGNEPSRTIYPDRALPGEFERFGATHGFTDGADWPELSAWHARGPGSVFVLRRVDGEPVLFNVYVRAAEIPATGPTTASLAAAAQRIGVDPTRAVAGVSLFAEAAPEERADAARLATGALMQHLGLPDLQAVLMHFPPPVRLVGGLSSAIGYTVADAGPRPVEAIDLRPHGVVGFVERIVLHEQGYGELDPVQLDLLAPDQDPAREARLREVLDEVFGRSAEDRRLRAAIEAAHLGPRRSEAALLAQFHISRTTWYRLLRSARERVLAHRAAADRAPQA